MPPSSATALALEFSPAIQDYLKLCYQLGRSHDGEVSMSQLAQALNVRAPSVTNMVKRLEELKLMKRTPKGLVRLTTRGEMIALEVIRHHRLLETFLVNTLGMDWAEAHKEAEVLEHYISERFETLIDKYLANPKHDPHGEPIPSRDGKIPLSMPPTLLLQSEGSTCRIAQVKSRDPAMLEYLQCRGLMPGVTLTIKAIEPFNGPLVIHTGHHTEHISREVAHCIYVEPIKTRASS